MLDVNVLGTVWLARAAVRHFRQQVSGGDIVIIGSVAGLLIGGGQEAVYAASKAAQINLGYALDRELRGEGIRTTVVAPAGVNTPFAAADGRFAGTNPEEGPFMDPADIAGAVLYTLSQPRRMRTELLRPWEPGRAALTQQPSTATGPEYHLGTPDGTPRARDCLAT